MKYLRRTALETRGAVNPGPCMDVVGTLFVGEVPALHYTEKHMQYGYDSVALFPAFHDGQRCWLKRGIWCAAVGYSASGTYEIIVPFEDGIKILIENDMYTFKEM